MAFANSQVHQYFAQYGAAYTAVFTSTDPASTAGDLYNGTAWASGDATISKDGGAVQNTTNTPAQITASGYIHSLVLTATEMQAQVIVVAIRDATATEVYGPITLMICTVINLGQLIIDASNLSNQPAMKLQGQGSGAGLLSTGGATGHGIRGVGQGSAYGLSAAGASAVFGTDVFNTTPSAENTAVPTDLLSYGVQMQALVKRFYNKVSQDGSNQKVYRDDGATVYTTMAVSDDGTTQVKGAGA